MQIILEFLKKIFVQHIEKLILSLLTLLFIGTLLNSTFSILHQLKNPDEIIYPTYPGQEKLSQGVISSEHYAQLLEKVQKSWTISKESRRNFFARKTETVNLITSSSREKTDTDRDGMPNDWELRYGLDSANPNDAATDLDRDSYSNLDEFIGGSDPTDLNSFPGAIKLRVLKIFRKGIQVNFLGYIKFPDASFQMQINWAGKTSFLKEGQKIRGFKIIKFTQASEKKFNPQLGVDLIEDTSFIKIQKGSDPPITLVMEKPSFEKELYACVQDLMTGRTYSVHSGSKIKSYKVLDITPSKIIVSHNKKIYTLQRSGT